MAVKLFGVNEHLFWEKMKDIADALLEKLGGDFMEEVMERFKRYMEHVKAF